MDNMIFQSIEFVAKAHSGQFRKGTNIPYIYHLMNVMKILCDVEVDQKLIVAGILHDVLEDTNTSKEEIEYLFGNDVLSLVEGESEPDKSLPWKVRKQYTLRYFKQDATDDQLIIACADKIDNARSIVEDYEKIGDDFWKRFNAGKKEQLWYYTSLSEILTERAETGSPTLKKLSVLLKDIVLQLISLN